MGGDAVTWGPREGMQVTHLSSFFRKTARGLPGCCPPPSSICLLASAPKCDHPSPNMGTAMPTPFFSHTCPAQSPPLVSRCSSLPTSYTVWLPSSHWPLQCHPTQAGAGLLHPGWAVVTLTQGLAESCLLSRPDSSFSLREPTPNSPLRKFRVCECPGCPTVSRTRRWRGSTSSHALQVLPAGSWA